MLFLKYLLFWGGMGTMAAAASILARDFYLEWRYRQALGAGPSPAPVEPEFHWRRAIQFAFFAAVPIIASTGIVVIPSGMGGVRVSQTSGTLPGTLHPGAHFLTPLAESIVLFDARDQLFTTGAMEDGKADRTHGGREWLSVRTKECLALGLAITIRYRLDPGHLDYIQANLPQPVERELVPPVVASAWRELVPSYTVRGVFAARREEIRAANSSSRTTA